MPWIVGLGGPRIKLYYYKTAILYKNVQSVPYKILDFNFLFWDWLEGILSKELKCVDTDNFKLFAHSTPKVSPGLFEMCVS